MIRKITSLLANHGALQSLFLMNIRAASLGVKFLLTLFVARFIGFEALGAYGLIAAATIVAPVFLGLALMTIINRRAITQTYEEITQSLRYYASFTIIVYCVLASATSILGLTFDTLFLALLVLAVVFLEHANNDIYLLLLNLSRPLAANLLHFIRTAGWMIPFMVVSFLVPEFRNLESLLVSWIAGGCTTLAAHLWLMRSWPWQKPATEIPLRKWIADEFKVSWYSYLTSCLASSSQYLNQVMITAMIGLELNGIYVFFTQVTAAGVNLIHTGIIQLSRPKIVRAFKAGEPAYSELCKTCVRHTVMVSLVMAALMAPAMYVATILLDRPLALEWFPLFWAVLAAFVLNMWADAESLVFYSQHRDDLTLMTFVVALTAIFVLGAAFIPFFSLWGAAMASIGAMMLRIAAQKFHVNKLLDPKRSTP